MILKKIDVYAIGTGTESFERLEEEIRNIIEEGFKQHDEKLQMIIWGGAVTALGLAATLYAVYDLSWIVYLLVEKISNLAAALADSELADAVWSHGVEASGKILSLF